MTSAKEEKDPALALTKYEEATQEATNAKQRLASIMARCKILRQQKQILPMQDLLKAELGNKIYKDIQLRKLINTLASLTLFGSKFEEGLMLLNQAQNLKIDPACNDYYATYYYMSYIYFYRKHEPEAAIECLQNVLKVKRQHPANHYTANFLTGNAYEKLGKKEEAIEHYKAAIVAGKRVTYKFDYSPAEKALAKLTDSK